MIPELREGVLKVEGAAQKEEEDGVDVEEKSESENTIDTGYQSEDNKDNDKDTDTNDKELEIKRYQISVLNQIQFIFGHLAQSQLQFHVPQGFWKTFKWVHLAFFVFFFTNWSLVSPRRCHCLVTGLSYIQTFCTVKPFDITRISECRKWINHELWNRFHPDTFSSEPVMNIFHSKLVFCMNVDFFNVSQLCLA